MQRPTIASVIPHLTAQQTLTQEGTLAAIIEAINSGAAEYSCAGLGIPGLRHFIYKSRLHIQITAPTYEEPYDAIQERRRYELSILSISSC